MRLVALLRRAASPPGAALHGDQIRSGVGMVCRMEAALAVLFAICTVAALVWPSVA